MGVNSQSLAKQKYKAQRSSYLKKGVLIAIISGILYGFYSAFLTKGMLLGVWDYWYYSGEAAISAFVCTYVLGAVGCAVNDSFAAIWMLILSAIRGCFGDVFRCFKSKPGLMMFLAALAGGPIANTAYVIALTMAGPIAAAISALCAPCGAIIGRVFLKQELNFRMICGIIICFAAAVVIGGTAFLSEGTTFIGCLVGLVSALGWGIEGAVAGFGTSMLDYEIGITLRQTTSGVVNLFILIPILCLIASAIPGTLDGVNGNPYVVFVGGAVCTVGVLWFVVSGFFANPAYSFWYKGNSMCGAALGITCNAMYSFWVPLALFIVFSVLTAVAPEQCAAYGIVPTARTPIQWLMAVVEVFGIWLIAMNPLDLFKKKEA